MSKNGTLRSVLEDACREHDLNLGDLTVLSAAVDPYRLDTPASHRDGEWLARQLNRLYGPTKRAHWRGLHYAISMAGGVIKPNGDVYINDDANWSWLVDSAAKAARWLGYIPFDRITDNRNAAPIIHRKARVEPHAYLSIGLDVTIPDADDIEPEPIATGFVVRQAFHFVIFGEKSSLEDVVLPIAREHAADLYLPTAEISDTLVYQIAKDAASDGRPMVMFTLSDCDLSGHQMPLSIARKLQAFKDLFFPDLRFEVVRVALTPDQVRAQGLPSEPMKPGERRTSRWREAFGVDQTEIDALTTPTKAHVLQRIVRQVIKPYLDPISPTACSRPKQNGMRRRGKLSTNSGERLDSIRTEATTKLEDLREQIDSINEQLHLSTGDICLPPVQVPEPQVDLDPNRIDQLADVMNRGVIINSAVTEYQRICPRCSRRIIERLRCQIRVRSREIKLSDAHETFSSEVANLYFDDASADFAPLHATIATLTADQRLTVNLLKLKEMSLKEAALASGRLRKRLRQTSQTR